MVVHTLLILTFFISMALSQINPDIVFLKGFTRLNDNLYVDYYFFCNGSGTSIQWQVNNDIVSLGVTDVGKTRLCPNVEVQCVATLLSSMPLNSIMVLSASSTLTNVVVNCTIDDRISESINSVGDADTAILNKTTGNVFLQYLFESNIANDIPTFFYICGVNDRAQLWQTTGVPSGFVRSNLIGANINKISDGIAVEVAFLIGYEPYSVVSILLMTRSNVNVTCASNTHQSDIYYTEILTERAFTESENAFTESTMNAEMTFTLQTPTVTTMDFTEYYYSSSIATTSLNSSALSNGVVIAIVLGVVVPIFILFVLVLLLAHYKCYKSHSVQTELYRVFHRSRRQKQLREEKMKHLPQSFRSHQDMQSPYDVSDTKPSQDESITENQNSALPRNTISKKPPLTKQPSNRSASLTAETDVDPEKLDEFRKKVNSIKNKSIPEE